MTARRHLLEAIAALHAALREVRREAKEEGDGWAGHAAETVEQAVADAAQMAEQDRMRREE